MEKNKKFFVTGIGTEVGKTIASGALVRLWKAAYWKPIQSGDLKNSDSMMLNILLEQNVKIYPERYKLNSAISPHHAAYMDGLSMKIKDFNLPAEMGNLIVEGAGGMFAPVNENEFIIDLVEHFDLPVILVCSDYLGSINHSLLSYHTLQQRGVPVEYIFLNGKFKEYNKRILIKNRPKDSKVIEFPELEIFNLDGLDKAIEKMKIYE